MEDIDSQMDAIIDDLDTLLWASQWLAIDQRLAEVDVENIPIDLSLCYLTMTWVCKEKFPSYTKLVDRIRAKAIKDGEQDVDGLLYGLI